MKKRIILVLAALTILLCVPLIANAQIIDSGECGADGDNVTWTLDDEGTLTISGEGDMADYSTFLDYAPWYDSSSNIIKVIIEQGVTSIGDGAFSYCHNLTSVNIPNGVAYIGHKAFYGCYSLTSITIPNSVTSIGVDAFFGTGYYDNTDNWENDVLYIGDCLIRAEQELSGACDVKEGTRVIACHAFFGCSSLTSIIIPDSVTSIGYETFVYCGNLNIYVSPNNQKYCDMDGVLFAKDKKTIVAYAKDILQPEYTIPDNVTNIGNRAFTYCTSLTNINIPDDVTSIGEYAFGYCENLTSIKLPVNVKIIDEGAFSYCHSLTSVTIPDSVTSIGGWAFGNCGNLNIDVSPNNQSYCDIDGVLFTKDKKTLVAYAKDKLQPEYIIPNGVTSIGDCAFNQCSSLTNVNMPDSITSIGNYAFNECIGLISVKLPDSVTSIGDWAFECCMYLKSITIPNSVISIGDLAFALCVGLNDVYYSGTEKQWKQIVIGDSNDPLFDATIHYNSKMPINPLEVQPVEPEKDTGTNKLTIPVTVTNETRAEELNDVRLYIAEYDADGRLTNVTFGEKGTVEGDTVIFTADIPDAGNYKIMLWDANNVPLMDAITNES